MTCLIFSIFWTKKSLKAFSSSSVDPDGSLGMLFSVSQFIYYFKYFPLVTFTVYNFGLVVLISKYYVRYTSIPHHVVLSDHRNISQRVSYRQNMEIRSPGIDFCKSEYCMEERSHQFPIRSRCRKCTGI